MASAGASLAAKTIFASVPVVGWAVGIAAAFVDAKYILPALRGKPRENARAPRLLEVPVGSNSAGAPRVWAIGTRVRVPTRVLWTSAKVRETVSGSQKRGTQVQLRRVYVDALVSLNDRPTTALTQLIGNGRLLLYGSRNLRRITTSGMSAGEVPGQTYAGIFMGDTAEPSFADLFKVGDIVRASRFVRVSGATNFNGTYWRVVGVAGHLGSTASSIAIAPQEAQSLTSLLYTGGTVFSPAEVEAVADAFVFEVGAGSVYVPIGTSLFEIILNMKPGFFVDRDAIPKGADVRVRNLTANGGQSLAPFTFEVGDCTNTQIRLRPKLAQQPYLGSASQLAIDISTVGTACIIEAVKQQQFNAGQFPADYDPQANFFPGSETQGEHPVVVARLGPGNAPAYRGMAIQGLREFYADDFGGQLPQSLEALIDPDAAMTVGQAVQAVLERSGVPAAEIDVTGVPTLPFAGMYLRGPAPALAAMQPMLVAYQLLGQERDGRICVFSIDNADVVQIENGSVFSDFGTVPSGESKDGDKMLIEDAAVEDLPTSVGVRHQDPDNVFADGYQHFGLRAPQGVTHQNEQELDLSNLVLSRKDARNLAATTLRRAWINRRTYRFTLPAAYLHLLENDLVTWTDDEGANLTARVIQRDIGSDFRVSVTALAEELNLGVTGSPVQTGADAPAVAIVPTASLRTVVIDAPAITTAEAQAPAIKIATCAVGGNFAGAQVWESIDGGSYVQVGAIGSQAVIGTLEAALTAQVSSEAPGSVTLRAQTVDVLLSYEGDSPLEACTQSQAELGRNWVCIQSAAGTELAAFTTVTPQGDGVYTLGGWLRGLRGTPSPEHAAGATLTLVWPSGQGGILRREYSGDAVGASIAYKVVPTGAILDDVAAIEITFAGSNAKPLPVIVSGFTSLGSDNLRLSWDHRSREVVTMGSSPPFPMDEPVESYRVDFYDPTGATLLRQKFLSAEGSPVLADAFVDYPASEQSADGYTPGVSTQFWIDVVQIGQHGDSPSIKAEFGVS